MPSGIILLHSSKEDFAMSLSDLASLGSFVSGAAVLASLIFIAFQLRQNTQAMRATASQANSANFHANIAPIAQNREVAGIWFKGLARYEELSNEDRARFILLVHGCFRFFEASRVQWRHGQLDDEHWHSVEATVRHLAFQPGIRSFWNVRRNWHSGEFQNWFESLPSTGGGLGALFDWREAGDGKAPATR
jgi:hypothetical protein